MLNTTTKLHMLLLFTIIAVALYMYFLYKEIKSFQDDIVTMKKQINTILQGGGQQKVVTASPENEKEREKEQQEQITVNLNDLDCLDGLEDGSVMVHNQNQSHDQSAVVCEQSYDDQESVHSEEIKQILTNIQDIEEVSTPYPDPIVSSEKSANDEQSQQQQLSAATASPNSITILEDDIISFTEKHTVDQDLSLLSDEELNKMKYDDLRNFLRKKGVTAKGSKPEVIQKIKSLRVM